jgi:hypothetical protein
MTDPRFDPAFQRGYSGPEPELVVRQRAAVPATVPPVRVPPQQISPPPVANDESARRAGVEAAEQPEQAEQPAPEQPERRRRRNPFGIALLASGVSLLILGGAMIWSAATAQNSLATQVTTSDTAAQAISIADYTLPPALLFGGILGVLGWLILAALDGSERIPRG